MSTIPSLTALKRRPTAGRRLVAGACGLLAALALSSVDAQAAITIGNITTNSADTSSLSTAHNHNQGTNGLLVVSVTTVGAGRDVTNVTYNSVALTHLCTISHSGAKPRVEVWYLVAPNTGNKNVVVTVGGGADKTGVGIVSYGGVNQTTPVQNCATATGTSATPSVNVTSAAGDLVQDAVGHLSTMAFTPGAGQTERWDYAVVSSARFGASTEAGASTVTMSWSIGESKEWAIAAFSIKEALVCAAVADPSYVAASAVSGAGAATLYWDSADPVLILRKTAAFAGEAPTNGTTYSVGGSIGAATVVDNDTVAKTTFTQSSLTSGTTYYYRLFARQTGPCYSPGAATVASASIRTGTHPTWSYNLAGGSMLKAGVAGDGTLHTSSNASRILSLSTTTGAQSWVPVATNQPIQSWLTWLPDGSGTVIGGDQSGRVYAVGVGTGTTTWTANLSANADFIQAAAAAQLRTYADAAFQAVYTGDVLFVGSRNAGATNCGGSTTNNKLFAVRASDGAVLWTFNGTCTSNLDWIVGMPYVDYARNRVYVASRAGGAGTQSSFWIIDTLDGSLVDSLALGHLETSPTLSADGATIYVGNLAGTLYAVNASTLAVKWSLGVGTAVRGFVWEDWSTPGRLYFSTGSDVRCVQDNGASGAACAGWTAPSVAGASTPVLLNKLYVGSSDGKVHQIDPGTGADEKQFPSASTLDGTAVGDVSTETGDELFVGTASGTVYKVPLPLP